MNFSFKLLAIVVLECLNQNLLKNNENGLNGVNLNILCEKLLRK